MAWDLCRLRGCGALPQVFVLVVQSFMKLPFLHDLAPTLSEPPFVVTQGVVLLIFIALGILAAIRFRPEQAAPQALPPPKTAWAPTPLAMRGPVSPIAKLLG